MILCISLHATFDSFVTQWIVYAYACVRACVWIVWSFVSAFRRARHIDFWYATIDFLFLRTKRIRWMVVIRNFAEVGLAIFYLAFIMERLVLPVYHVYETQHLERKWFVKNIIECSIPGILYFITGQYLLLHAWLNAWAEMLQFADRLFYKVNKTHLQYFTPYFLIFIYPIIIPYYISFIR